MIKLLVGLGNPGRQYDKTRHNVGFLFLDAVLEYCRSTWSLKADFQARVAECALDGRKLIMLKPETFMNRSGISVGKVVRYYKLLPEEILIVHDELDLDVGVLRLKKGGGHAGHNGLRDIIDHLGSKDFYRLRIGIGRPLVGKSVADYVLSLPSKDDATLLDNAISLGLSHVDQMLQGDISAVMNKLN